MTLVEWLTVAVLIEAVAVVAFAIVATVWDHKDRKRHRARMAEIEARYLT